MRAASSAAREQAVRKCQSAGSKIPRRFRGSREKRKVNGRALDFRVHEWRMAALIFFGPAASPKVRFSHFFLIGL
jgi:hypothetical protein